MAYLRKLSVLQPTSIYHHTVINTFKYKNTELRKTSTGNQFQQTPCLALECMVT